MRFILLLFFTTTLIMTHAQDDAHALAFAQIPEAPSTYTAETVMIRSIQGLGFRYYWATDSLRQEDLAYAPSPEARTSRQTLNHILELSNMIRCATEGIPVSKINDIDKLSFEELRSKTLSNLKTAVDLLASGDVLLKDCSIIFQRGEKTSSFPYWNTINGPLADALWHAGQLVSFRRASGNPFNSKVNVFLGIVN